MFDNISQHSRSLIISSFVADNTNNFLQEIEQKNVKYIYEKWFCQTAHNTHIHRAEGKNIQLHLFTWIRASLYDSYEIVFFATTTTPAI
jgi:hypothetical protein